MYSSIDEVLKLLPEAELLRLAADNPAHGVADPEVVAVVNEAIDQADKEIDSFVGMVKSVPLAHPPLMIINVSAKLAAHNLYLRRAGTEETEEWQRETAYIRKILLLIAEGKLSLGAEDGAEAEPEDGETLVSAPKRIFTEENWERF